MKKYWVKKWVKALRSGKYKQGRYCLRQDDEYCCLGVLCEVAGLKGRKMPSALNDRYYRYGQECAITFLPDFVRKKVGMKSGNGTFGKNDLVCINDDSTSSFEEIANIIEQNEDIL